MRFIIVFNRWWRVLGKPGAGDDDLGVKRGADDAGEDAGDDGLVPAADPALGQGVGDADHERGAGTAIAGATKEEGWS